MAARALKTVVQATALLERHAELEGQLATLEARRARMLARANGAVDAKTLPLIEERDALAAVLQPWWAKDGPALAGDRKSIELGGCEIGTRLSAGSLAHGYKDDAAAAEALAATRWRNRTTRVVRTLDKMALKTMLELRDKTAQALAAMGFRIQRDETFFIKRVAQSGTVK